MLYSYTGNDSLIGFSQTTLFIVLAINVFFIGMLSKRLQKRYLPIFFFIYTFFYIISLYFVLYFLPPNNSLNIVAVLLIMGIFLIFDSFIGEIGVHMQQKVMLDLIPSKYRNSILSLYSSLIAISVTFLYPIVGYIVASYQLEGGLLFMCFLGILGCLFLVPVFTSSRMKPFKSE